MSQRDNEAFFVICVIGNGLCLADKQDLDARANEAHCQGLSAGTVEDSRHEKLTFDELEQSMPNSS
jgi:hypothetical protein